MQVKGEKILIKLSILLFLGFLLGVSACAADTYEDPPNDLSVSDLVGNMGNDDMGKILQTQLQYGKMVSISNSMKIRTRITDIKQVGTLYE